MLSISSPNPYTVVFDAVGTLIYAQPTIAEVYQETALQFGWSGNVAEIKQRFAIAFSNLSERASDFATSESLQQQRWRSVVGNVFGELRSTQVDSIFETLWNHFAQPTAWAIYADALAAIELCEKRNILWCIGSNFDSRLHNVIAGHSDLASCHRAFCSSEVGFDKPAAEFFTGVESSLNTSCNQLIMVGDDLKLDAQAAEQAGWIGLWLNRDKTSLKPTRALDWDVPPQLQSLEQLAAWL